MSTPEQTPETLKRSKRANWVKRLVRLVFCFLVGAAFLFALLCLIVFCATMIPASVADFLGAAAIAGLVAWAVYAIGAAIWDALFGPSA